MKLYRALDKLSVGIARLEAFPASRLKPRNIDKLLRAGAIKEIRLPPIAPLFPEMAAELSMHGIDTVEQLFDSDLEDKKEKVLEILTVPTGCQHCGG